MSLRILTLDLIHYGKTVFDPSKFTPVANSDCNKPTHYIDTVNPRTGKIGRCHRSSGLWASPIDAAYGWKEWATDNDFITESLNEWMTFRLSNANVLVINSEADLEHLLWDENHPVYAQGIRFGDMRDQGVQAIYLTARGERETKWGLLRSLYGWDCESVVILDPAPLSQIGSSDQAQDNLTVEQFSCKG